MKKETIFLMMFVLILSAMYVISYSTYGAPSEFGNESTTTCYIGGDFGVVNCTGSGTFGKNVTAPNFIGNVSGENISDTYVPYGTDGIKGSIRNVNISPYNLTLNFVKFEDTGFRVNSTFNSTTNVLSVTFIIEAGRVD